MKAKRRVVAGAIVSAAAVVAWKVLGVHRPFTMDVAARTIATRGLGLDSYEQAISLDGGALSRVRHLKCGAVDRSWDGDGSGRLTRLDLIAPKRACNALNAAVGAGAEGYVRLTLTLQKPKECSVDEARWKWMMRATDGTDIAADLEPVAAIQLDFAYEGRPIRLFQSLKSAAFSAYELRDEVAPFGDANVTGTKVELVASPLEIAELKVDLPRSAPAGTPARAEDLALVGRVHAPSYESISIDGDDQLRYWRWDRLLKVLAFLSAPVFVTLELLRKWFFGEEACK